MRKKRQKSSTAPSKTTKTIIQKRQQHDTDYKNPNGFNKTIKKNSRTTNRIKQQIQQQPTNQPTLPHSSSTRPPSTQLFY